MVARKNSRATSRTRMMPRRRRMVSRTRVSRPRRVAVSRRRVTAGARATASSRYTRPAMRERIRKRLLAGSRGGRAGHWSARKAQLLKSEYEKAGGGYRMRKPSARKHLVSSARMSSRMRTGTTRARRSVRTSRPKRVASRTSRRYATRTPAMRRTRKMASRR
ncbi:hypothetical protein MYSTI_05671 [Myxococcus stipitatus DSM 14675]|uniref:Uncharacterized protein n=2 Tax=Myxococcus stipitatus TaxID=83455 RepID=L7UG21_MYXSD|nr:hypothetical protein MYSTI_05671 [Myxococcus stipitatus DSM 14675]